MPLCSLVVGMRSLSFQTMRRLLLLPLALLAFTTGLRAQVSIHNGGGTDPDGSAMLDVQASDKGVLVPRVDIADLATAAPVTAPADGLLVYNTNLGTGEGYYYWTGSMWVRLMSGNTPPLLTETDPTWTGTANTTGAISRTGTVTIGNRLTLNSAGFDEHLLIQRTGAPDGHFATSTGNWVAVWPGASGDNANKGIRLNNSGTVQLMNYTTNGIVRTTGTNGTLSSTGGGIDLTSEVTGILPVANGGTGSSTQGWVDLTTNQTAAGNKTWTGVATFSNTTPVRASNGTAALPAYSYTSDPDIGMWRGGTNTLSFSTTALERLRIASNGTVQVNVQNPTTTTATGMQVRRTFTNSNGTRYGIDNQVTAASGTVLTAAREFRAGYNALTNNLADADLGGYTFTGYAAFNYMVNPATYTMTTQVGGMNHAYNLGTATTVRGAYNYGRNRGTAAVTSLQGAYNYALQDVAAAVSSNGYAAYNYAYNSNGTMTNAYAAYNYVRNNTNTMTNARGSYNQVSSYGSGTITNAYGVQSYVHRSAGTMTNGYAFYGSFSGTIGTKWGVYITGEDKNYFSNNVGIGQTTPTYHLHVNGRIGTNAINETSDMRLKKDITALEDPLGKVLAMRGVTYRWRTGEFPEKDFDKGLQYGLIAQELEAVVPELVHTDSEGWKSIEYSHIVPLLIEAIKELKQENTQLHSTLDRLVLKVEQLDRTVNASGPSIPSAAVSGP